MAATSIQWTNFSINPFRARLGNGDGHYCEKLSPGCKQCYSSRLQPRFRMPQFQEQRGAGVEHYLDSRKLQQVLDRKKPTKIFWCDMTDMFGAWVPNEWIAACFGVMAATPQHTHQVLTKRAERLPEVFASVFGLESFEATVAREAERHGVTWDARGSTAHLYSSVPADLASRRAWRWPLPNVHLGVSAEDQQRADERIPHLLQCPAAVRFVSAEPLLGPIDFRGWGDHAPHPPDDKLKDTTWSSFQWEEWIPASLRKLIEDFWSESYGRGPWSWLRDHAIQQVPRTGARGTFAAEHSSWLTTNKMATRGVTGRYVHLWNNIGRVVTDAGEIHPASGGSGSGWLSKWLDRTGGYRHKLNWIIVGGESGPGARECNVEWIRSIVKQCRERDLPVFVKQLGATIRVPESEQIGDVASGWSPCARVCESDDWLIRLPSSKGGEIEEWAHDLRVRQFPEARS